MLKPTLFLLKICLMCGLTACAGNSQAALETTPATRGEALFVQGGCQACHAFQPGVDVPNIGPNLAGAAALGAQGLADPAYTGQAETVTDYLRESILKPEVYVTPGFEPIMPAYAAVISDEDLAELVKYLEALP